MECNKDEAARAKEIAERKLSEREYAGAKKFALKALNLYPALEGLSQFLTTVDVYVSAENKISGEMDWYGILGVNPFADDETVRKQYRKLALMLHPDKNKSPGAEGAFMLVSEAWSLLSDKAMRLAYNQKRSSKGFQNNAPNHVGSQPEAPHSNGCNNLNKNATSNVRTGNNNARAPSSSVPPPYKTSGTFWTICNRCRTHFEYLRIYLNHPLLCPNCKEAFVAVEKGPRPSVLKPSNWSSQQHHQNSHPHAGRNKPTHTGRTHAVSQNLESSQSSGMSSFNNSNLQWGHYSRMAGFGSKDGSLSTSVKQQISEKVRRECEGAPSVVAQDRSQMYKTSNGSFNNFENPAKKMLSDDSRMYMPNHTTIGMERTCGFSGFTSTHTSMIELSIFELRKMLINKAQIEIHKKLQEWRSLAEAKITNKDKGNKRQKGTFNDETNGPEKHGGSTVNGNGHLDSDVLPVTSDGSVKENKAYIAIYVPDSDFHNFDLDRAENSFEEDQVWASYDDDDGMPRYYAKVHKVLSTKPFRLRISWLNSRSNSELGPMGWIGSGFTKTCGDFRAGKHEITESLNSFSHKVRWTKGTRGVVRIFPGRGDVWALYRNWSPDWDENTPDDVVHKYDMVEVLEDFNEEEGVLVTPLVKVDGFRIVFHRHSHDQVRKIPKAEMFRFSHQVPYYLLTGKEAHNAPKGCRELDPAATPLDLQTLTETNEALDNVGKSKEDTLPHSPEKHVCGKGIELFEII